MDPFIAQIVAFGGNFAPRGWAFCQGQLLAIAQNTALFSILGTTYGGDGRTSFGLPDLQGRSMVHPGSGPGLPTVSLGEKGGSETHTITTAQMPSHNHSGAIQLGAAIGTSAMGENNFLAFNAVADTIYSPAAVGSTTMASDNVTLNNSGGGQAYSIRDPYLAVSIIIALVGTFPSRN